MIKIDEEVTFLLVDDESMVLSMLGTQLERMFPETGFRRHKIEKVSHGEDAIEAHKKMKIDMTFLDLDLPDKNGIDVLKEIREDKPKAYIVIVSGLGTADNVKSALSAGANGFIVKPFTPEKVKETLKKYKKTAFAHLFK